MRAGWGHKAQMASFYFPVGHPSEPECRKGLWNRTINQLTRLPDFHRSSSILSDRIFEVWNKRTGRKLQLVRCIVKMPLRWHQEQAH